MLILGIGATVIPAGSMFVNARAVAAVPEALLFMVKVRVVTFPGPMVVCSKNLENEGCPCIELQKARTRKNVRK